MRRWLFNILAALSLVLGFAVTALWIRSLWTFDGFNLNVGSSWCMIQSEKAELLFGAVVGYTNKFELHHWRTRPAYSHFGWRTLGFGYINDSLLGHPNPRFWVPHGLVAAIFSILPTLWIIRRVRRN